jgi:hypothetical protein
MFAKGFTYNDALVALLTVETLAFAGLAAVVAFSVPSNRVRNLPLSLQAMGFLVVAFVTVLAVGAFASWWSIFVTPHWPSGVRADAVAVSLGLAIVAQPVVAGFIAAGLRTKA